MLQTWPLELSIYIQSSSQTELKAALVHLVSTKIVPSKNSFISEVPAFMLETSLAEIISFSSGLKDSLLILLLMVGSCSVFVLPSRIHILLYNTLFQLLKHISSLYHQLGRWATSRSIQGQSYPAWGPVIVRMVIWLFLALCISGTTKTFVSPRQKHT